MKISELIKYLEETKEKEGDLEVCCSESHEYWGSLEIKLEKYNCQVSPFAQPDGPKSGKSEKAVILNR